MHRLQSKYGVVKQPKDERKLSLATATFDQAFETPLSFTLPIMTASQLLVLLAKLQAKAKQNKSIFHTTHIAIDHHDSVELRRL
jgi:hypothetical protein